MIIIVGIKCFIIVLPNGLCQIVSTKINSNSTFFIFLFMVLSADIWWDGRFEKGKLADTH